MPDFEELYPGRFVKGVTLEGPTTVKIVSMVGEPLEDDDGHAKLKAILTVKMRNKKTGAIEENQLVWNKTNALLTANIHGRDYAKWTDKLITIAYDPSVMFGKEKKGGIRVCGSPALTSTIEVSIKRPRRKRPEIYLLQPTAQAPTGTQPAPKIEPELSPSDLQSMEAALAEPTDADALDRAWAAIKDKAPPAMSQLYIRRLDELRRR